VDFIATSLQKQTTLD